jgi:hypothetical protein
MLRRSRRTEESPALIGRRCATCPIQNLFARFILFLPWVRIDGGRWRATRSV